MFSPINIAIRIKMRIGEGSRTFTTNVTGPEGRPIKILNMFRNASRYAEAEARRL